MVVHCFTGSESDLRSLIDLGCHIGITGWVCDDRPERGGAELAVRPPHPIENAFHLSRALGSAVSFLRPVSLLPSSIDLSPPCASHVTTFHCHTSVSYFGLGLLQHDRLAPVTLSGRVRGRDSFLSYPWTG